MLMNYSQLQQNTKAKFSSIFDSLKFFSSVEVNNTYIIIDDQNYTLRIMMSHSFLVMQSSIGLQKHVKGIDRVQ